MRIAQAGTWTKTVEPLIMNLYGEEVTEHMTLRDMEYIAAIAEDKSITRASTRLFVA